MYYPALGGAEVHLKEVSEGLAARGHDVTVLTANVRNTWDLWPAQDGALPGSEVISGVKVIRVHPDAGRLAAGFKLFSELPGGHRTLRLLFTRDALHLLARGPRAFGMLRHILRARVDIVGSMNWYWPPAVYTYLARRIKPFRLVGIPLFHTAEDWCNREIYKRMLVQCDAVIANTRFEGEFASQRGARQVEVAGVGIHPEAFTRRDGARVRAHYGLGDRPVVGFVGRATPNKGIGPVVESMRQVWAWNSEVRLVLAGPAPGQTSPLEGLLGALTETERERVVRIHDFAEQDKASIYDAFDAFVLPSTGESFGLGYLEAWMCRKPVIGARIGPTACIIDEGENGLLANPDDPVDLARAIIDLLSDRAKRERMGQRGYEKTLAQYTWGRVTDKVERLYHDLLTT